MAVNLSFQKGKTAVELSPLAQINRNYAFDKPNGKVPEWETVTGH